MNRQIEYAPGLTEALGMMLHKYRDQLIHDPQFMRHAFDSRETENGCVPVEDQFSLLAGEAEKTLLMIEPHLSPKKKILEIGGGVGLVYALLRIKGYSVISLEPGSEGFGSRHKAGLRLMKVLGIDPTGWLKSGIEEYIDEFDGQHYDLIFSYFVLEHISDINRAFLTMSKILALNGKMIHQCPNYTIPFEPHYNLPLIPFKPSWTSYLFPGFKKKGLWKGLNFITLKQIETLCACYGLVPSFRKGMTAGAFDRVLTDPVFAARKKGFVRIAQFLSFTGTMKMLYYLPSILDTPMEFIANKVEH